LALLSLPACGDTIGESVALPLSARGGETTSFEQGAWQVTLERAEVGLGPLYLCPASIPSDELCETALLELRETVSLDGLDPEPQELPPLRGNTGVVRSSLWDYGVSWPLTFRSPTPNPGAPGGHSARFAGAATDGTRTLFFEVDIDVAANAAGRLAAGQVTDHEVRDASSRLEIVFDPVRWWRNVDFDALAVQAFAEAPDGELSATVRLAPESAAYGSLVHEMTSGARPRFEWSRSSR
jgi:hypothetical protein